MKIGNKISQTMIRANFSTKTQGTSGQIHRNPVVGCTEVQCKYCKYTHKSKILRSSYTKYWYQSKLRGNCTTRNLVYLITWSQCKKQYVGETKREIKVRMTEHQRDTRNKRDTPVANHFDLTNHSIRNMRFQVIEIRGWSGGAMVLGKPPVLGHPTILIIAGQGPIALAVGAGGGLFGPFYSPVSFLSSFSPLWETARYRLKCCLKGPLNPKQPTNHQIQKVN